MITIKIVTTPPHKKVKKSLTGFWGLKIEMTLLQFIVLFIGMPRSLQRISQGVTDFASKNRFSARFSALRRPKKAMI